MIKNRSREVRVLSIVVVDVVVPDRLWSSEEYGGGVAEATEEDTAALIEHTGLLLDRRRDPLRADAIAGMGVSLK